MKFFDMSLRQGHLDHRTNRKNVETDGKFWNRPKKIAESFTAWLTSSIAEV